MCNHYRNLEKQMREWAAIERAAFADTALVVEADVWPRRPGYVMRVDNGARIIEPMQWGVPLKVPGKRPGTTVQKHITNVRNLTSPFWKSMIARPEQRCLVPFTQFAEPKPGKDPETGRPAEYWFRVREREIAAFAGIWRLSEDGPVYAFLTCAPNALVAPLHSKAMPVILAEDQYDAWLSADYDHACAMAEPFPSQLMALESV